MELFSVIHIKLSLKYHGGGGGRGGGSLAGAGDEAGGCQIFKIHGNDHCIANFS